MQIEFDLLLRFVDLMNLTLTLSHSISYQEKEPYLPKFAKGKKPPTL